MSALDEYRKRVIADRRKDRNATIIANTILIAWVLFVIMVCRLVWNV